MTSPPTDAMEDVATLLNANVGTFSITGWTAVETLTPQDLTDLEAIEAAGLQVLVSPGDMQTQRGARRGFQDFPEISVQIIDRLTAGSELTEGKARIDFANELKRFLLGDAIASLGKPVSANFSPLYGPNLIHEDNVFASIITVTYRKDFTI